MKYPCTDGVNRDREIEEYLMLQSREAEIKNALKLLQDELGLVRSRAAYLRFNHLGLIGQQAVDDATRPAQEACKLVTVDLDPSNQPIIPPVGNHKDAFSLVWPGIPGKRSLMLQVTGMDGLTWPFKEEDLKPSPGACGCGQPLATVSDGLHTVRACRDVLLGRAEGGPEQHTISPPEGSGPIQHKSNT